MKTRDKRGWKKPGDATGHESHLLPSIPPPAGNEEMRRKIQLRYKVEGIKK